MESLTPDILVQLGIPSSISGVLYLIMNHQTKERKAERDAQYNELKQVVDKHLEHHYDLEKDLIGKVDKIYERLNPAIDILNHGGEK